MDWKNALYFGDNLEVLRATVPDQSIDLIYLDPPFNSNVKYNVLFERFWLSLYFRYTMGF